MKGFTLFFVFSCLIAHADPSLAMPQNVITLKCNSSAKIALLGKPLTATAEVYTSGDPLPKKEEAIKKAKENLAKVMAEQVVKFLQTSFICDSSECKDPNKGCKKMASPLRNGLQAECSVVYTTFEVGDAEWPWRTRYDPEKHELGGKRRFRVTAACTVPDGNAFFAALCTPCPECVTSTTTSSFYSSPDVSAPDRLCSNTDSVAADYLLVDISE